MALTRTLLGWAVVVVLFLLWSGLERRVTQSAGPARPSIKAGLPALVLETLLLTLLAGLWFGSLGSGGAWLLFLVVGALMEIPSRLRSPAELALPWVVVGLRVGRTVIAGVLLGLVMG